MRMHAPSQPLPGRGVAATGREMRPQRAARRCQQVEGRGGSRVDLEQAPVAIGLRDEITTAEPAQAEGAREAR
jgi:hypothetical protein